MKKGKKEVGRPKKYGVETKVLAVRCPVDLIARLEKAAKKVGKTRNEFIVDILMAKLKKGR
jgi:hypothetical protein